MVRKHLIRKQHTVHHDGHCCKLVLTLWFPETGPLRPHPTALEIRVPWTSTGQECKGSCPSCPVTWPQPADTMISPAGCLQQPRGVPGDA